MNLFAFKTTVRKEYILGVVMIYAFRHWGENPIWINTKDPVTFCEPLTAKVLAPQRMQGLKIDLEMI